MTRVCTTHDVSWDEATQAGCWVGGCTGTTTVPLEAPVKGEETRASPLWVGFRWRPPLDGEETA